MPTKCCTWMFVWLGIAIPVSRLPLLDLTPPFTQTTMPVFLSDPPAACCASIAASSGIPCQLGLTLWPICPIYSSQLLALSDAVVAVLAFVRRPP